MIFMLFYNKCAYVFIQYWLEKLNHIMYLIDRITCQVSGVIQIGKLKRKLPSGFLPKENLLMTFQYKQWLFVTNEHFSKLPIMQEYVL